MSDTAQHDHHDPHGHPPHLAHHFDTPTQQFESGKLGMWVFLATEILMFGGLFCAYAVYRANNPDVFMYAHQSLNTTLGAVNTVILLASSFTMAWGVRAAQLGQRSLLVLLLALTFLGGVGFMVIKTVEYTEKWHKAQWVGPGNLYHPLFSSGESDAEEESETSADFGAEVPPENGVVPEDSPIVEDAEAQASPGTIDQSPSPSTLPDPADSPESPAPGAVVLVPTGPALPADRVSLINPAPLGPIGMRTQVIDGDAHAADHEDDHHALHREDLAPLDQNRTHIFYQIYYLMTGLHGLHVLIGMGLIAWVGVRALGGQFGPAYYTPVDLVGLYWHLVDLIWIFLFPLLYLIH